MKVFMKAWMNSFLSKSSKNGLSIIKTLQCMRPKHCQHWLVWRKFFDWVWRGELSCAVQGWTQTGAAQPSRDVMNDVKYPNDGHGRWHAARPVTKAQARQARVPNMTEAWRESLCGAESVPVVWREDRTRNYTPIYKKKYRHMMKRGELSFVKVRVYLQKVWMLSFRFYHARKAVVTMKLKYYR